MPDSIYTPLLFGDKIENVISTRAEGMWSGTSP